jgi:hypothetical protein
MGTPLLGGSVLQRTFTGSSRRRTRASSAGARARELRHWSYFLSASVLPVGEPIPEPVEPLSVDFFAFFFFAFFLAVVVDLVSLLVELPSRAVSPPEPVSLVRPVSVVALPLVESRVVDRSAGCVVSVDLVVSLTELSPLTRPVSPELVPLSPDRVLSRSVVVLPLTLPDEPEPIVPCELLVVPDVSEPVVPGELVEEPLEPLPVVPCDVVEVPDPVPIVPCELVDEPVPIVPLLDPELEPEAAPLVPVPVVPAVPPVAPVPLVPVVPVVPCDWVAVVLDPLPAVPGLLAVPVSERCEELLPAHATRPAINAADAIHPATRILVLLVDQRTLRSRAASGNSTATATTPRPLVLRLYHPPAGYLAPLPNNTVFTVWKTMARSKKIERCST